jgi:hypothetical protein
MSWPTRCGSSQPLDPRTLLLTAAHADRTRRAIPSLRLPACLPTLFASERRKPQAPSVAERRELIPGAAARGRGITSWAAAHPVSELIHVDAVRYGPSCYLFAVDRVGQVVQGPLGHLRQTCRVQQVNHMLPGELHRNHLLCEIAVPYNLAPRSGVGAAARRRLVLHRTPFALPPVTFARLRFLTSPSGITIRARTTPGCRHAGTSSRLLPALRHIEPTGPDDQTRRPHDQPTGLSTSGNPAPGNSGDNQPAVLPPTLDTDPSLVKDGARPGRRAARAQRESACR